MGYSTSVCSLEEGLVWLILDPEVHLSPVSSSRGGACRAAGAGPVEQQEAGHDV